jgi:hypothetical protein
VRFLTINSKLLIKTTDMKKFLLIILLTTAASMAKAQFTNTKWNGNLNVPDPMKVILDFKKDVVEVVNDESGEVLETMSYAVHADTLIFKKVSGQSACPERSMSKLQFSIADDKLTVTPLSDDCQQRKDAWTKEPFLKLKQ